MEVNLMSQINSPHRYHNHIRCLSACRGEVEGMRELALSELGMRCGKSMGRCVQETTEQLHKLQAPLNGALAWTHSRGLGFCYRTGLSLHLWQVVSHPLYNSYLGVGVIPVSNY